MKQNRLGTSKETLLKESNRPERRTLSSPEVQHQRIDNGAGCCPHNQKLRATTGNVIPARNVDHFHKILRVRGPMPPLQQFD